MELLDALSLKDERDYLLLFSVIILLIVVYALFRSFKATKNIEAKIEHFSTLTTDTFAKHLNSIENRAFSEYDITQGNFGTLSNILDLYSVSTTDPSGVITYVNEKFCKSSGFSKEKLVGKTHKITSSNVHDATFWSDMWQKIKQQKVWHGEIANMDSIGNIYWQDTIIFPLSLFTNSSSGFISLRTDITKIKNENFDLQHRVAKSDEKLHQAESLLLHSEKMSSLGTISAGIAHEINNPIAFISNNLTKLDEYLEILSTAIHILKKQYSPTDLDALLTQSNAPEINNAEIDYILNDYKELINETLDGVSRVKNIAADLKSFSHKGSDEFKLTDIHHCIDTALNLAKNELKYKAEIKKSYVDALPQALCVESKISQVLLNLLINASHAIETNGILTITTQFDASNIYISVKDNGHGMDKETQKNIFEPFFTTKPVGKGTGLGLSLSHDIIIRHKGTISVRSEKGIGTEFVIQLPINEHQERVRHYG